jgi:hypothetical protein
MTVKNLFKECYPLSLPDIYVASGTALRSENYDNVFLLIANRERGQHPDRKIIIPMQRLTL